MKWIDAVMPALSAQPQRLENASELLDDLQRCRDVLAKAKEAGKRWHFEMDI